MNKSTNKPLILVDGSSYLFRAFHALPPLANAKGMPTGAIYGVLNMLRRLLKDYEPEHIAVVFDSKSKNFRHQLYPAYKANRTVMPDELQVQIQPLFTAIRALGLPLIIMEGIEADDIIATFAVQAQRQGQSVLISTGDKDLAQLVNSKVTLINTMSQQILDEPGVVSKFGVSPKQIVDYLSLVGDSVDNIPGVPNVGPKTAANWLKQYASLDNIIENADKIPGKVGENLRSNIQQILLGKELATVKTDIPLPQSWLEMTTPNLPDNEQLRALFTELEFKTWLEDLAAPVNQPIERLIYETVVDPNELAIWIKKLKQTSSFALCTFSTELDQSRDQLIGISLAIWKEPAIYIPLAHDLGGTPILQLDREWVLQQLAPILNDPQKIIFGHHLKKDLELLGNYGVSVKAGLWDVLLASYLLDSSASRHDLDILALKFLSRQILNLEQVAGKGAKQLPFNHVPLDQAACFAAQNADTILRLQLFLIKKLEEIPELLKLFSSIDIPLLRVLVKMELYGVLIDADKLTQQSKELSKEIQSLERQVYDLADQEFNLGSPKQLQEILFDKLKLPILKKTPTGQPSTAEEVLQELAFNYPIPDLILKFRRLCKLKSTYTDKLPEEIKPKTGRIHTSYHQTVTSTGRLSSTDPNLQNIPIRSEEGRKIRQAFVAPSGSRIMAADYSQIELRIMAHLSQDCGLLAAFAHGLDIHRATAAEVYGVELTEVTANQRRNAKAINFGLMYGMSSYGLGQQLGITREEAQQHIDVYFKRYPKVREYMDQARVLAAKQGYVKTLLGRRVHVADIKASNQIRRQAAERQAINAPLQGTAADMIKMAMIAIDRWLTKNNSQAHMLMQVHDELIFEVPANELPELEKTVRHCMEGVIELSVPLVVDIGIGDNWDQAH
ncbi:MAG: DNA polymerase I [Proteobacteria bacterium]|nr:DNA polymerase I [Pseudomonadota bacterium]